MDIVSRKPGERRFSDADRNLILASTFVEQIEFHPEIESTNDRAMALARQGVDQQPLLILAESQTRGRGRGANSWWATDGALTFTVLLKVDLAPRRLPKASLTAGLAVCEAVEEAIQHSGFQLKWPNDIYLNERKLSGILIELPPGKDLWMAIGIGINVNNSSRHAPPELQRSIIALCDTGSINLSLTQVLIGVLNRLEDRLGWIGRHDDELCHSWRKRCLLTGRQVRLEIGTRKVVGQCRGIDRNGALLIDTSEGTERFMAGAITQF
jgi:BirA family biotin operon repressor/biotin-[acetyl-CoA-carboxylase] ligase